VTWRALLDASIQASTRTAPSGFRAVVVDSISNLGETTTSNDARYVRVRLGPAASSFARLALAAERDAGAGKPNGRT